jgi:DNA-cytosine methyltransferase
MRILSLFNGISCGRLAFERAGIKVNRYISYEIDKYANQIAQANYPNDEYYGDVTTEDFTKYKGEIDIVIGGSPCTYWSIAKKDRETTSEGIGFELFSHFVRAIKETGAKYFLYENNYSIHKDIKAEISKALDVDFIMINSALISAQQRKRCYWTNIPDILQPDDKGIILKDILENGIPYQDKLHVLTASYAEPVCIDIKQKVSVRKYQVDIELLKKYLRKHKNITNKQIAESLNIPQTTVEHWFRNDNCFAIPEPELWFKLKNLLNIETDIFDKSIIEFEIKDNVYETADRIYMENGKGATLTTSPYRIGQIGKGSQGDRIYSVKAKSICLSGNGGGRGAKTGLYKIDLPDGDYIIRKLTPLECERLQTIPDYYTNHVSNTQRYKGIGNGWTIDIIAHILKNLK